MISKVVVSRKWGSPEITAFVSKEDVGASIRLEDFVKALAAEIGSPVLLVTKTGLEKALLAAHAAVVAEMKSATRFVV